MCATDMAHSADAKVLDTLSTRLAVAHDKWMADVDRSSCPSPMRMPRSGRDGQRSGTSRTSCWSGSSWSGDLLENFVPF